VKPLSETPNEFRRILDNAEAKIVLMQLGIMEKLLEYATRPVGMSLSEPWSARIYSTDHPTHWIVADYFTGFANPADNGFAVACIPKSQVTLEQFREVQRKNAAARFPGGVQSSESGQLPKSAN
jgi:hypothetical protein